MLKAWLEWLVISVLEDAAARGKEVVWFNDRTDAYLEQVGVRFSE
jgi:hypothetical protein